MSESISDNSKRDGGTTSSLSPHLWNQISQVAFLTALISAGLFVVLFVVAFFTSNISMTGAIGPPHPVSVWSGWLGVICFFVFAISDATTLIASLWGWWRGYINSTRFVWGSLGLVLAVVAAFPTIFVVLLMFIPVKRRLGL